MAKKGLMRKSAAPVAFALSGLMCFSTAIAFANRNLSASAAPAAASTALFTSDYNSREEVYQATLDLNDQIAAEGMVLVKNNDNALPLTGYKPRVSVFGAASISVAVGASNTSGDTSAGEVNADADLYSSLADAGFVVNPAVKSLYENGDYRTTIVTDRGGSREVQDISESGLLNGSTWDAKLKKVEYSYNSYSDAAIIILSDTSGDETCAHSRDFDKAQKDLVKYVGEKFGKVILLINNSYPFELGWAQEADYVDSIIIVGQPGNNGFNAVGKILNGEVNPSGHLADLYAADFTVTPSYANFNVAGSVEGMVQYQDASGDQLSQTYLYQYEEGIYVGYRYYETMATLSGITVDVDTKVYPSGMDGEDWYQDHVVYPFGYGLSYTEFAYSDVSITGTVSASGKITAQVRVTNVGDAAGKDVVQLYYSAPWNENTVEKSAVVLGDYAKTSLLQPGESEVVTITLSAADMASYDSSLKNGVGGYVLDAGDYVISLRSDSHNVLTDTDENAAQATIALATTIDSGISLDTNGNDVHNQFADVTEKTEEGTFKFDSALSRSTMATATTTAAPAAYKLTAAEEAEWTQGTRVRATTDDELYAKWADKTDPKFDGNGPADPDERDATAKVTADQLIGKAYDDELWDELLDELTIDELQRLFTEGGYGTIAIDYVKLPGSHNMDGPYGWTSARGDGSWDGLKTGTDQFPLFCSAVMVACTFNKELAYEEGKMIGEQGLWGNAENGGTSNTWTGWYSPALNIHRSPFDSRGTEYYSEDPVLSGYSAANAALGAQEKGTFVTLKHFAVYNDGNGSYRAAKINAPSGFSVWATEQTLREIYLKGFEIAVKTGAATGVMTSFARIGYTYCGANYALCTEVLRNEWGFNGIVVSDIVFYGNQDGELMALAGNNLALIKANTTWNTYTADGKLDVANGGGVINVLYETIHAGNATTFDEAFEVYYGQDRYAATALYNALREGAHGIMYAIVNSNAMQIPYGATVNYDNDGTKAIAAEAGAATEVDLGGAELSTITATYGALYETDITYSITAGALPTGLSLNAETGKLTGTPTTAGTYTFTVTASAKGYESASVEYTVVVAGTNSDVISAIDGAVTDIEGKIDGAQSSINSSIDGAVDEITASVESNASSGCNGSLETGLSIIGGLLVVGAAFVAIKAVKNRKEND